ncbi:hypothetical protein [Enterococcus mundtii]|uniref:hypothetical protein n=1 Tax=Enterococcus mundtii TaxID=53346 RepID=UPI0035C78476
MYRKGIDSSIHPKEVKTGSYAVSSLAETVIVAAAKKPRDKYIDLRIGTPTDYDTTATSADAIATVNHLITLSVPGATVKKEGSHINEPYLDTHPIHQQTNDI